MAVPVAFAAIGSALGPVLSAISSVVSAVVTIVSSVVTSVISISFKALELIFVSSFKFFLSGLKLIVGSIGSVVGMFTNLFSSDKEGKGGLSSTWVGRRLKGAFSLDSETFKLIRTGLLTVFGAIGLLNLKIDESKERLQSLLLVTRHAAGFTYSEIIRITNAVAGLGYATQIQGRQAAAIFLAQGRIRGPIFSEAMAALPDLSAALGVELPQAAQRFANALARPEQGLALLEEMGVVLPAAFIEQFNLMATSSMAGFFRAQQFILETVRNTVRGTNELYRNTLAGFALNIRENLSNLPHYFEPFIKPFAKLFANVLEVITSIMESNREFFADIGHRLEQFISWVLLQLQPLKEAFVDFWPHLRPVLTGLLVILPSFSVISHLSKAILAHFGLMVGVISAVALGFSGLIRVLGIVLLIFEGVRRAFSVGEVKSWLDRLVEGVGLFLGVIQARLANLIRFFNMMADLLGEQFRAMVRQVTLIIGSVESVMVFLGHFFVDSTIKLLAFAGSMLAVAINVIKYIVMLLQAWVGIFILYFYNIPGAFELMISLIIIMKREFALLFVDVVRIWKPVFAGFMDWLLEYWTENLDPFLDSFSDFLLSFLRFFVDAIRYAIGQVILMSLSDGVTFLRAMTIVITSSLTKLVTFLAQLFAAVVISALMGIVIGLHMLAEKVFVVLRRLRIISPEEFAEYSAAIGREIAEIKDYIARSIPKVPEILPSLDGLVGLLFPKKPRLDSILLPDFGRLIPSDRLVDGLIDRFGPIGGAVGATGRALMDHIGRVTDLAGPLGGLLRMIEGAVPGMRRPMPVDLGLARAPRPPAEAARPPAPLPNIIPAKVSFIGLQELYKNIQTQSFQGRMVTLTEQIVNQGFQVVARLDDVNDGLRRINIPGDPGVALFG